MSISSNYGDYPNTDVTTRQTSNTTSPKPENQAEEKTTREKITEKITNFLFPTVLETTNKEDNQIFFLKLGAAMTITTLKLGNNKKIKALQKRAFNQIAAIAHQVASISFSTMHQAYFIPRNIGVAIELSKLEHDIKIIKAGGDKGIAFKTSLKIKALISLKMMKRIGMALMQPLSAFVLGVTLSTLSVAGKVNTKNEKITTSRKITNFMGKFILGKTKIDKLKDDLAPYKRSQ